MRLAIKQAALTLASGAISAFASVSRGVAMSADVLFGEVAARADHIARHRAQTQAAEHMKNCAICQGEAARREEAAKRKAAN